MNSRVEHAEEGWSMQRKGGACRGRVKYAEEGWSMQRKGEHAEEGWSMQRKGGACRGRVEHAEEGWACRGRVEHAEEGWSMQRKGGACRGRVEYAEEGWSMQRKGGVYLRWLGDDFSNMKPNSDVSRLNTWASTHSTSWFPSPSRPRSLSSFQFRLHRTPLCMRMATSGYGTWFVLLSFQFDPHATELKNIIVDIVNNYKQFQLNLITCDIICYIFWQLNAWLIHLGAESKFWKFSKFRQRWIRQAFWDFCQA